MTILAITVIQRALYTLLKDDGVLRDLAVSVYDAPPQRSRLPYIVIGEGGQRMQPADDVLVTECQLEVHVWTEANSRKRALEILNRLYVLLHLGGLILDGFEQLTLRVEQSSVILTEEATLMRGTMVVLATVVEV